VRVVALSGVRRADRTRRGRGLDNDAARKTTAVQLPERALNVTSRSVAAERLVRTPTGPRKAEAGRSRTEARRLDSLRTAQFGNVLTGAT
jgi:hypothetical protein